MCLLLARTMCVLNLNMLDHKDKLQSMHPSPCGSAEHYHMMGCSVLSVVRAACYLVLLPVI